MKVRTRLTILFTVLITGILLVFAALIYLSAKKNRETEFFAVLQKEAVTKANLFFEAKVDTKTLQDIYRNNRQTLNEVEVAIYDTAFQLLYHDAVEIDVVKETPEMIRAIRRQGPLQFYQQGWQIVGLRYPHRGQTYIVTAAAYDQSGYRKLHNLLTNSAALLVGAVLVIFFMGNFMSKKAFEPVRDMTEKAQTITANNLDLRLNTTEGKDELSELANTFNRMLDRLENSFDAQQHFVSGISHEMRTPLAAIITELELALGKERNPDTDQRAIQNALNDAKKLARLSNSLLDLAKAGYDPAHIAFKTVRVDEALLDARQQVQQAHGAYRIDIHFDRDFDSDREISVSGNEYLLKVAFANLFENGCKFSATRQSTVFVDFDHRSLRLKFADTGIGIPEQDIPNIFRPFFRGANNVTADGSGIGLYLAHKIVTLHGGSISVASVPGVGTTFSVELPHL